MSVRKANLFIEGLEVLTSNTSVDCSPDLFPGGVKPVKLLQVTDTNDPKDKGDLVVAIFSNDITEKFEKKTTLEDVIEWAENLMKDANVKYNDGEISSAEIYYAQAILTAKINS